MKDIEYTICACTVRHTYIDFDIDFLRFFMRAKQQCMIPKKERELFPKSTLFFFKLFLATLGEIKRSTSVVIKSYLGIKVLIYEFSS